MDFYNYQEYRRIEALVILAVIALVFGLCVFALIKFAAYHGLHAFVAHLPEMQEAACSEPRNGWCGFLEKWRPAFEWLTRE